MYVYTQRLHCKKNMTEGKFLSGVQQVSNSKFSFS